MSITVSTA